MNSDSPNTATADEKRRRAICEWWKRKTLDDFIARVKAQRNLAP